MVRLVPLPSDVYGRLIWNFDPQGSAPPVQCTQDLVVAAAGDPATFLATIADEMATLHEAVASINCTLDSADLKIGPENIGPTFSVSIGQTGNQGTSIVPPNTALLVRKEISTVSARYAGRLFYPGIPETILTLGGNIDPAGVDQFQDAFDVFFAALDTLEAPPVVLSRESSDARFVDGYRVQTKVATQRRRLRR